jgi:7-carboxy-7-deazaguanine synthase
MREKIHVTIETSAVVYRKVPCDLLSVSPKLPGTVPDLQAFQPAILKELLADAPDYQFKFVVANLKQVCEVTDVLETCSFIDRDRVMLMPNAKTLDRYRKIAPQIAKYALHENLRFCPRLHLGLKVK